MGGPSLSPAAKPGWPLLAQPPDALSISTAPPVRLGRPLCRATRGSPGLRDSLSHRPLSGSPRRTRAFSGPLTPPLRTGGRSYSANPLRTLRLLPATNGSRAGPLPRASPGSAGGRHSPIPLPTSSTRSAVGGPPALPPDHGHCSPSRPRTLYLNPTPHSLGRPSLPPSGGGPVAPLADPAPRSPARPAMSRASAAPSAPGANCSRCSTRRTRQAPCVKPSAPPASPHDAPPGANADVPRETVRTSQSEPPMRSDSLRPHKRAGGRPG